MTADDMVTVPRELAEKALFVMRADDREDPSVGELDAILNPPPEFDPAAVEALAARRYRALGDDWDDCFVSERSGWLASAREDLTALRAAGWEMVETTELEALRTVIALTVGMPNHDSSGPFVHTVGGGPFAVRPTEADAIRKAKAAGR